MIRHAWVLVAAAMVAGCEDDPAAPVVCETQPLPLSQSADGPVVVDVGLEVEEVGIILVATATDPQGGDNLRDVVQRIDVFQNVTCDGPVIPIDDDLVDSGVEETFGAVISAQGARPLYNDVAGRTEWPVRVEFRDIDGNVTAGRVLARVTITS